MTKSPRTSLYAGILSLLLVRFQLIVGLDFSKKHSITNIVLPHNYIEKIRIVYNGTIYPMDRQVTPSELDTITISRHAPLVEVDTYDYDPTPRNTYNDMTVKAN